MPCPKDLLISIVNDLEKKSAGIVINFKRIKKNPAVFFTVYIFGSFNKLIT